MDCIITEPNQKTHCENKAIGRGMCWKHYRRVLRTGSAILPPRDPIRKKVCVVCGEPRQMKVKRALCWEHLRQARHKYHKQYVGKNVEKVNAVQRRWLAKNRERLAKRAAFYRKLRKQEGGNGQ